MADYRRHYDDGPGRHDRDWADRASDEVRSWLAEDEARRRRENDEHDDRYPYGGDRTSRDDASWWAQNERHREDRASRWEAPRADRDDGRYGYAGAATGAYRTGDREYHDRDRHGNGWSGRVRHPSDAADEYYRAARQQRDDYMRWEGQSPGAEWEEPNGTPAPHWARRERGGYWRQYDGPRSQYYGRGPKNYQRSDDRVREEICDSMTDDPMLDASDITVAVSHGEVTLGGTVSSRDQKRRAEDVADRISGVKDVTNQLRVSREANGHTQTAAHHVTQASGQGTPSKSSETST